MKYAVTGANGLIGKALVKRLRDEGHDVVVIFRSETPEAFLHDAQIRIAKGDISDVGFLRNTFAGIDCVFHVAAFAKPWAKNKQLYYHVNEVGTENVCKAALATGVKRLVYTSSAGAHGAQQGEALIDENTWPSAYDTDYEQSKFNGMKAALSYNAQGLEVNVVSPARVYSPGDLGESNVPVRMMKIYLKNKVGVVPASGQGIGSYVLIDDIIDGHMIAMHTPLAGEEYLLGGVNTSYIDFFKLLAEVTGKKYPVIKVPYRLSLGIGKIQHFAAEKFDIKPTITTPWVRKYIKNWGISSKKIETLGYSITDLSIGMERSIKLIK